MDTNNLQQSNNFADGMNTDTSDAFLSESSYRLANNLRYITNELENSGELHVIEGASYHASITGKIIATTNLRDLAVFVVEDNNNWQVWTCKKDGQPVRIANIPAQDDRVIGQRLSLVTRYENDDVQKLYIADGKGPVIVINLVAEEEYTRLELVESFPSILLTKPVFCGLIDGSIKASVVEYSYQLYKKHGQQSEISPSTKLIPLFKGNTTAKESNKILGYLQDETTNKGVKIKINLESDVFGVFDRIKVYRVSYIEAGQLPQIECVYDDKLVSGESTFVFEDHGNTALQVLSLEEYNSITGIHIIPKTIESKDDYLFAANIKDDSAGFITDWDPKANVRFDLITVDLVGDNSINPDVPLDKPDSDMLENSIDVSDGASFDMLEYIESTGDVRGYWNPQVSYMFRSLRRGETYRFGIILYDKKGRSSGVLHVRDITIDVRDPMFEVISGRLSVKPVGIHFKVANLPQNVVAYEIVRCGKSLSDTQILTLGILSRPIRRWYADETQSGKLKEENYPLTPTGLISLHDIIYADGFENLPGQPTSIMTYKYWYTSATNCKLIAGNDQYFGDNKKILQFISPEIAYLEDSMKDSLKGVELLILPVCYVSPQSFLDTNITAKTIQYHTGLSYGSGTQADTNQVLVVNYGNEYANIITGREGITVNADILRGGVDELITDYINIRTVNAQINFGGNGTFPLNYYNIEKRYSYAKLYYDKTSDSINSVLNNEYDVSSIGFPQTLNWDDFASAAVENYTLSYPDKVCAIGGDNYVNWVSGQLYGRTDQTAEEHLKIDTTLLDDSDYKNIMSMGPGGKCAVISVDTDAIVDSNPQENYIGTYICNLKKRSSMATDEWSKKYSTYRSFGDHFKADIESGYIFDGDCFIQPFEYVAQHKFAHASSKYYRTACKIFVVPLETSTNLAYTSGYEFNKEFNSSSGDITFVQNEAGNVNGMFIQDRPLYIYNSTYSTIDTSRTLTSKESIDTDELELNTDCRVFHSNVKTNNEYIDSWLKFMPANFLDVDTRSGSITGLRTFKNQLVFWQEHAMGVLSVNERSVISDESNMPLMLGSGGVLTRFDYVTNTNGMHEKDYSDAQSNTTLYWWDKVNKSICGYSGGQDAIELSKIKFVLNYLNKNTPVDQYPVVAYDNKTKDVIANVVDGEGHESGSVVYNEHLGHFVSLYNIKPVHKVELPDETWFTTDHDIFKWDALCQDGVKGLKNEPLTPYLKHVVNHAGSYTKVFDNAEFAGRVYGGNDLSPLKLTFSTPLKQKGELKGSDIENREYNFKYIVPRNGDVDHLPLYGDRLRGKTMQCELESSNNSYDFSLQYINTKFRVSWS